MPISSQPVFAAGDVPTATQLNAWMTQIKAAFNEGGSTGLTTDDFRWPMKAGGHINMGGNAILGVPRFGSTYNLTNRPPWASAQMVLDEVEARGGASVLLMGNTTQPSQTGKDGLPSIKPGSNTHVLGHGHTSILGGIYAKGKQQLFFNDLQMNGANQLIDCDHVTFLRVNFTGTGAYQLNLKNCSFVTFIDCRFTGAATVQLKAEGFRSLVVTACEFVDCADYYAQFYIADGTSFDDLQFQYNILRHPSTYTPGDRVAVFLGDQSFSWNDQLQGWHLSLRGNLIGSGGPGGLYASGVQNLDISFNLQLDATHTVKGSWLKEVGDTVLLGNIIKSSDYGVMVGDTNLYPDGGVTLAYDYILAADESYVWRNPHYSGSALSWPILSAEYTQLVMGCYMETADAALPVAAIWRLGGTDTRYICNAQIYGNLFNPQGGNDGYRTFRSDSEASPGASIGGSATVRNWFVFVGNTSPNTNTTNTDLVDNTTTNKVVFLDNNV